MTFLVTEQTDLVTQLRESLDPVPTGLSTVLTLEGRIRGDHDLNPASAPDRSLTFTPAAVLVLSRHAGQISFPGGRSDPEDRDAVATALRESQEEISLDPSLVEVVGALTPYITVTQYSVTPIVGLVRPAFDLQAEEGEVSEIFEVPLAFLLDHANRKQHSGFHNGVERFWYAIPFGDYYIWGATAGMIKDLSERVSLT
jgi:8-oxo-dGTP pyrophosphatase MutT (NUDIX family)